MADDPKAAPPSLPGGTGPVDPWPSRLFGGFFVLRGPAPAWQALLFGCLCIAVCGGGWWWVTRGGAEARLVPLPSPHETFASFPSLWFDRELTRNTYTSLRRVALGFGLAAAVGIPLGVLCGCFAPVNAFFGPISIFGRNIPTAALIPLTFALFGIGELQKVLFIFISCVAFVFSDTARAIADVSPQYVDTAYTLGASRRQVILKVLVPLAMPSVFNSLRLLFGLAFGYIMLAELVKMGNEAGGLGHIINVSQRLRKTEHILLVLMIIPAVALAIDRTLYWVQKELFPYRYGGSGVLNWAVRAVLHGWEDLKGLFRRRRPARAARSDGAPEHPVTPSDQP
jgi:ABC-type nitrate/sulfonate/bicarbonate transport system permease component